MTNGSELEVRSDLFVVIDGRERNWEIVCFWSTEKKRSRVSLPMVYTRGGIKAMVWCFTEQTVRQILHNGRWHAYFLSFFFSAFTPSGCLFGFVRAVWSC